MSPNDDALGAALWGAATVLIICLLFGLALHWADPDPQPLAVEGTLEDGTETVQLWPGAVVSLWRAHPSQPRRA